MKKILSVLITLSLILSYSVFSFADVNKPVFSDVDFNTDVGKDIQKLLNAGIISGNGDGTFTPQNPVTRAELCKMVNNLRGYNTLATVNFTDVSPDKWYYTHVLIGKQAGYINGFPDGTFRGDEYITREQVCAIICRAFGIYDLGLSAGITDEVSDWALPYVNALVTNKLITLEAGNTFRATQNMKRGELSTSLSKFVVSAPSGSGTVSGGSTGGTSSGGSFSGGSWGGSTGGTSGGGSSGGSTGGSSSSGTTGGSTGSGTTTPTVPETPGGSTGGNESGNTGSGTTTPDMPDDKPDEMTPEEIKEKNSEIISKLTSIQTDIKKIRGDLGTLLENVDITIITPALEDATNGVAVITNEYIRSEYSTYIDDFKEVYYDTDPDILVQYEDTIKLRIREWKYFLNFFGISLEDI